MKAKPSLEESQLILVKDENNALTERPLCRIIEVHPGSDGILRVVTVKLREKTTNRPITKLCPLPVEDAQTACDNSKQETHLVDTLFTMKGSQREKSQREKITKEKKPESKTMTSTKPLLSKPIALVSTSCHLDYSSQLIPLPNFNK